MFGQLVPTLADDLTAYVPWAAVCLILAGVLLAQGHILTRIEDEHERTMMGLNPAGAEMNARLANAAWNDRVRRFKRRMATEVSNEIEHDEREHL